MRWRLDGQQKRKYHAAEQLGLLPSLRERGWAGLSAKDTGRIGALIRQMSKQQE